MRGRIFAIVSGISLLLCVALIVARSLTFDRTEMAVVRRGQKAFGMGSRRGFLSAGVARFDGPPLDPRMVGWAHEFVFTYRGPAGGHGDLLSGLGFDYYDEVIGPTNVTYPSGLRSFSALFVSYGTLIFLTALLPAIWGFRLRRRQIWRNYYRQNGRCTSCGYQLTGNTSGVCPECGKPIAELHEK